MKKCALIFFLIISNISHTQDITYRLVFFQNCSPKDSIQWGLVDKEYNLITPKHNQDYVALKHTGEYRLSSNYTDINFKLITIDKEGHYVDTILQPSLNFNQYIGYSDYSYCGDTANGKLKDYYLNGNLRISGTFKDSQPSDTLYQYYPNGNLASVFIQYRKENRYWPVYRLIEYNETGIMIADHNTHKEYYNTYYDSGKIKETEFWSNKYHKKVRTYREDGGVIKKQRHRKLIQYDSLSKIKSKATRFESIYWKLYWYKGLSHYPKFYEYRWTIFDAYEEKAIRIKYTGETKFPLIEDGLNNFATIWKITIFDNNMAYKKIERKYRTFGDESISYFSVYIKYGRDWIYDNYVPESEIHEYINKEINKLQ